MRQIAVRGRQGACGVLFEQEKLHALENKLFCVRDEVGQVSYERRFVVFGRILDDRLEGGESIGH